MMKALMLLTFSSILMISLPSCASKKHCYKEDGKKKSKCCKKSQCKLKNKENKKEVGNKKKSN